MVIKAFLSFAFLRRARDTSVLMALAEQLVSHRSNTSHRQRSLYLPFLFPLVRSVPLSHRLRPICGVRMFARFPCLSTLSRVGPLAAKLSRQLVSWNACNCGSLFNEKHLLLTKLKTNASPQLVFSYWLDAYWLCRTFRRLFSIFEETICDHLYRIERRYSYQLVHFCNTFVSICA